MPDLINMAIERTEADTDVPLEAVPAAEGEMGAEAGGPEYPWGLTISLTQEEMDKLGLVSADLHPGQELNIRARGRVKTALEGETEGMVELQITDMAMDMDMGFDEAFDEAVGLDVPLEDEGMLI